MVASCLPDLQHLAYPYFFEPAERSRRDFAIRHCDRMADLVFALSKFARQDLTRTTAATERRIKSGVSLSQSAVSFRSRVAGGNRQGEKNLGSLRVMRFFPK